MSDEIGAWILTVGAMLIGVAIGASVGYGAGADMKEKAAIAAGHAQYNPTNANFEWKVCK